MANPYSGRPDYTFWRQGVAEVDGDRIDPVIQTPFLIDRSDRVATAGSCFAQHLSRTLEHEAFRYFVTEEFAGHSGTVDEGYGVFPARFGNVYTTRQLLQLFDRAYGLFRPHDSWCYGRSGGIIDPFRPRVQAGGYPSPDLLEADRNRHFAAVRKMFEHCDVFIFTLGLTEYWFSVHDGAVFPLPPGAISDAVIDDEYRFGNLTVAEMLSELEEFVDKLREVNPAVKLILTVSPVALIATYEDRHVLVSTMASKAALRATAEEFCRNETGVTYFPSYEIIAGPQARGRYFAEDLRDVRPEGVAHVMTIFKSHFLRAESAASISDLPTSGEERHRPKPLAATSDVPAYTSEQKRRYHELGRVVCDEESLVGPVDLGGEASS